MSSIESQVQSLQQELAALAGRLRALQDRQDITAVLHNAARALDRLDRELLAAQYHADAEVDYGAIYRGPIAGFLDVTMQFQGAMRDTQHFVANLNIQLDGDSAVAESYVYAHHVIQQGDAPHELIVGGRYLDRLTRRDGAWRIAFRTELLDWGRHAPIPERWFDENKELPKGARGRADRSYEFLR